MAMHIRLGAVVVALLLEGCSKPPRGERPLETIPVSGVVHVDGQPAERVQIDCYPAADSTGIKYKLSTVTDKDGRFSFTTYESGDGVPEGTYTLTFQWLELSLSPSDKFKGEYANPKTSQHKITVTKGQNNDIGTIELSSTGPG